MVGPHMLSPSSPSSLSLCTPNPGSVQLPASSCPFYLLLRITRKTSHWCRLVYTHTHTHAYKCACACPHTHAYMCVHVCSFTPNAGLSPHLAIFFHLFFFFWFFCYVIFLGYFISLKPLYPVAAMIPLSPGSCYFFDFTAPSLTSS